MTNLDTPTPSDESAPGDIPGIDANAAASLAMALGHGLRMQILCRLIPFGECGLSAGTLSTQLAVVPSSLSFHLQQLTRAGIFTARHDGRSIFYSVDRKGLAALHDFLSRLIDPGDAQAMDTLE